MQNQFQNLKVWQKARVLVKRVYELTKDLPKEEQYGLTGQLRRAAVSVPVNIAEGNGRYHKKEYLQFLYIARGSVYEVLALVQLAQDLAYLKEAEARELFDLSGEVTAMLNGLIRSLRED